MQQKKFTIDQEFQSYLIPLTDEEFDQLEQNILSEGCRDSLVVWAEENILLDGHNRFNICSAHEIDFGLTFVSLPDRQSAINWIIDNQLGRRNLSPVQLSYYRGKRYNVEKDNHGGDRKSKDQNDPLIQGPTAARLAAEWGVSAPTVKRDGRFADVVDKYEPDIRQEIIRGDYTKKDVITANGDGQKLHLTASNHAVSLDPNYDGDEWYTPAQYIESARLVMGGIDLDPASCEEAQSVINATSFYTKEDDALDLENEWFGRVWLNPPYSTPLIQNFVSRLIDEYDAGNVKSAVILTNNSSDTKWFHSLLSRFPACFTAGRIQFWRADHSTFGARQGQTLFYLGDDADRFQQEFSKHGIVVEVRNGEFA